MADMTEMDMLKAILAQLKNQKSDIDDIKQDMATKEDLTGIRDAMATKEDMEKGFQALYVLQTDAADTREVQNNVNEQILETLNRLEGKVDKITLKVANHEVKLKNVK
jgi:hypothetical protein